MVAMRTFPRLLRNFHAAHLTRFSERGVHTMPNGHKLSHAGPIMSTAKANRIQFSILINEVVYWEDFDNQLGIIVIDLAGPIA